MSFFPPVLENLVDKLALLPGIGVKSAQRLAFFLISMPENGAEEFAQSILDARNSIRFCSKCQNLTDDETCPICRDSRREPGTICVVSDPKGVLAIERAREYKGVYHVLHGVISPANRIGPDDLRIRELVDRIGTSDVTEIIMATNPDTEGETTARYISRLIAPFGVKVTRLAYGIPVGSSLEFADDATLTRALEGRQDY